MEELFCLAKEMREDKTGGKAVGLNEYGQACESTPEASDSAVGFIGDANPLKIARELVAAIQMNVTID